MGDDISYENVGVSMCKRGPIHPLSPRIYCVRSITLVGVSPRPFCFILLLGWQLTKLRIDHWTNAVNPLGPKIHSQTGRKFYLHLHLTNYHANAWANGKLLIEIGL
jgi:hypothetical protein